MDGMVRAKFVVDQITQHRGGTTVVLVPVTSGSKENESFWKYTPSGKLEMWLNEGTQAASMFHVGQEFYLDFTPATQEQPTLN